LAGLWDFTEAYFRNASEASYPLAVRELAIKNGIAQRIPPPQARNRMVRLGLWVHDAKVSACPVNIAAMMLRRFCA